MGNKHGNSYIGDISKEFLENCKFIENNDYTYEKTFTVDKVYKNAYVEFDGLDTYCDVYLNNVKIGEGNFRRKNNKYVAGRYYIYSKGCRG